MPFIYAKITSTALVLIDTGCGGAARDENTSLRSLRVFLETYNVTDNDGKPLNENGNLDYVVVCSHCHFDHIGKRTALADDFYWLNIGVGAIEQFTDAKSSIWTSSYDKSFIDGLDRLPTSSLCRFFGMETPKYKVTHWAADNEHVMHHEVNLGFQIIHTPGHTPDELAVWDASERTLYVGDTLYEWAPIIFPAEGSLKDYSDSIARLKDLVRSWNAETGLSRVRIACGHVTSASDATEILDEVDTFMYHVIQGWVEVSKEDEFRGEVIQLFERSDGKFSFSGPKRLFDDFRADVVAMAAIERRQTQ